MTDEKYWCDRCNDFVVPIRGEFTHPHLGQRTSLMCPKHNCLVYLKEEKPKELA